jgi:hypothetical protein
MALHLAAGGLGNAPSPEQHHPVDSHIMLFGHRPPNGPNHCLDIQRQTPVWMSAHFHIRRVANRRLVPGLDFSGDDQLFFAGAIDRKRRAASRP